MKYPKVLVVIPTKNAETTLEKCLRSVCALDYPNFDVVVIDALSSDRTTEIVKKFKKVKIISQPLTISGAYNYALKNFKHVIFAFTDADCIVPKNWLRTLIYYLNKEVVAVGGFYRTPADTNFFAKIVGLEFDNRSKNFPEYVSRLNTGNLVFLREVALKIGGFDEKLGAHQDMDFGYKLQKAGYRMCYVNGVDVLHYHRSNLKDFFKQQYWYGKEMPKLYFKYRKEIKGDHITNAWMNMQPILYILVLFALVMSVVKIISFTIPLSMFLFILTVYIIESLNMLLKTSNYLSVFLPIIFLTRAIAWTAGGLTFAIKLFANSFRGNNK